MSSLALSLQESEHSSFSFLSSPSLFIQLSISFGPQKCLGRTAKRWKQNMACYTVLYTEMGKNVSFFKMILNYVLQKIEEVLSEQGQPACIANVGLGESPPASTSPHAYGLGWELKKAMSTPQCVSSQPLFLNEHLF